MTVCVAREVATEVLHRVAEGGAWAAAALDAELRRAGAGPRDAALATAIVYGALRVLPEVDAAYEPFLTRRSEVLNPWARAAFRAGAFQLLHLSRVPPHAVVDDMVAIVRRARGPKLGGLVNAVLRKVARSRPVSPVPPTRLCVPGWLRESIRSSLGPERAGAFLAARRLPPPIGLRVSDAHARLAVADAIRALRPAARVEPGSLSPLALLVHAAGDPRELPGYREGRFSIQEQGAQAVGLLVDAQPGHRVADACAGRGGKTAFFAQQVGPSGHVMALDISEPKLERIDAELLRLGIEPERVSRRAVDLTVGLGGIEQRFERVLVDAPCTGLGTIHRRPELLLRVGPEDPARLARLQLAILEQALRLAAPGAILTYAVCSPTAEEGAGVAAQLSARHPELSPIPPPSGPGSAPPDADGVLRIGPWPASAGPPAAAAPDTAGGVGPAAWDADGYQVARWRVQRGPSGWRLGRV